MMADIRINRINQVQPQKTEKKAKKEEQQDVAQKQQFKQKSAGEVLDYMANSGALNKSQVKNPKKVDVAKYVDAESAKRIEDVMKAFDENIFRSAEVAINEFGLSQEDAQEVALANFNKQFLS